MAGDGSQRTSLLVLSSYHLAPGPRSVCEQLQHPWHLSATIYKLSTTFPQVVNDISSADELLRYAAAGQLARLLSERKFLDHGTVAQGAGFAKAKRGAGEGLARAVR